MVLLATLFFCSFAVGYGAADIEAYVTRQEFKSAIDTIGSEMIGMRELIGKLEETVRQKSALNDVMVKRIFELEIENEETKTRLSDLQNAFKKQKNDRPIGKARFPAGKLHPFAEPIWQGNIQNNPTPGDEPPLILERFAGIQKHDRSSGNPGKRNGRSSGSPRIRNGRSPALTEPHQLLGRQAVTGIAFSVYATQDQTALGHNQVIKYNGIRVNDGNGYDAGTGIFTAPRAGLYLFSIFIEDYHDLDLWVSLRQDGVIKTQAVAEPYGGSQNVQGGNVVLLHLAPGSKLWLSIDRGSRIQAEFSTFSGVLLY